LKQSNPVQTYLTKNRKSTNSIVCHVIANRNQTLRLTTQRKLLCSSKACCMIVSKNSWFSQQHNRTSASISSVRHSKYCGTK